MRLPMFLLVAAVALTGAHDGESLHVITGDEGREIVARLYFVDTPESVTAYRGRLDEEPGGQWRVKIPRTSPAGARRIRFGTKHSRQNESNAIKAPTRAARRGVGVTKGGLTGRGGDL
jgi:hypothetical protein